MIKIAIASDHAGYDIKNQIIKHLKDIYQLNDMGCYDKNSTDYPDYAKIVTKEILSEQVNFGILLCYTGIGMSIASNRHKNIRAALCYSEDTAKLSREHNNANIACIGTFDKTTENIIKIINIFVNTNFEGGRHIRRIDKIEI